MEEQKKLAEYYITRIRSLSSSTSKVGFTFLIGLTLIWIFSISPNFKKVEAFAVQKQIFDTLQKTSAEFDFDEKINIASNDSSGLSSFLDSVNPIQKRKEKELTILKTEKKNEVDSLRKETRIQFDLIGYKIQTPFNDGVILWMLILFVVLFYIFGNRIKILTLVSRIVRIYYKEINLPRFGYTDHDLQVPFWISPLPLRVFKRVDGDKEITVEKNDLLDFINWKNEESSSRMLTYVVATYILIIQTISCYVIWNASKFFYFNSTVYLYVASANLIFLATTYLIYLWFRPITIPADYPIQKERTSISRRHFVVLGLTGIALTATHYLVGFLPSLTKAVKNNKLVKRFKKQAKYSSSLSNLEGFFINEKKGLIHYFHEKGKSVSLKSVSKIDEKKFLANLRPIGVSKILEDTKLSSQVTSIAAEKEAIKLLFENKLDDCFKLLLIAIRSSHSYGSLRLIDLSAGLLIRYDLKKDSPYRRDFSDFIFKNEHIITEWKVNSLRFTNWKLNSTLLNEKSKNKKWFSINAIKWNKQEFRPGIIV